MLDDVVLYVPSTLPEMMLHESGGIRAKASFQGLGGIDFVAVLMGQLMRPTNWPT